MMLAYIAIILLSVLILRTMIQGAPYVPSNEESIETMLDFLVDHGCTRVVDLGSGDGRILMRLAEAGIKAEGFEINPLLVLISEWRIRRAGLHGNAHVYWKSFWKADLSHYDGVVVFGVPHIMKKLQEKLGKELQSGTPIVSHVFKFPTWNYMEHEEHGLYFYIR